MKAISRMTVSDILNISSREFSKLNEKEMRMALRKLVSAGNKRLRSFERAGESSPATRSVMNSGGAFSTRGKDIDALRNEFTRARNFMTSATGSRRGWQNVKNKTIKTLLNRGVDIRPEDVEEALQMYSELKEVDPAITTRAFRYEVLKEIADVVSDESTSYEEKFNYMQNRLTDIYEEWASNDADVSGFFEM